MPAAAALAGDVAAADGVLHQPELRMLEEVRGELAIDRLHAVAIVGAIAFALVPTDLWRQALEERRNNFV